jgi:hypothetical protein
MTDRNVLDITPDLKRKEPRSPRPFSDFAGRHNLVLLGDAGAGKTHLFEEAASASGGQCLKARAFLLTPNIPAGAALFIDALDETRSGRGDQDKVDALVQKLFDVSPMKLRISCRVADWLGETDLAAFQTYFQQHGGVTVLALQTLSRSEQVSVLMASRSSGTSATSAEANAFLVEAENKGLGEFTLNPQNLLMLWDAVKAGQLWPTTRKELFELSTALLLREHNKAQQRREAGKFDGRELRDAAGAICAIRLVSDVLGVSLLGNGDGPELPSYRSLADVDADKAQAALGRRVFVAEPNPESMDYAHRTIAEYLGAGWIAAQVQNGLPIGRVLALIGIDWHPASELRGLHAWLAVLSPDNANRLIESDPYGALTYGDAASLSPGSRLYLLEALARLSEKDPWFRSGRWESPALGMLARPDMIESFRAILNSSTTNFGLRSVVVDALAAGPPMPAMFPDLVAVLAGEQLPFAQRAGAMTALERLGQSGTNALVAYCKGNPPLTENALRLRTLIIAHRFSADFAAADVTSLLADVMNCGTELAVGTLWVIRESLPFKAIPDVLNAIQPPVRTQPPSAQTPRSRRSNLSQVGSTIVQILLRYLREAGGTAPPSDILRWLRLRFAFREQYRASRDDEIAAELKETPELLRAMTILYFDALPSHEERFSCWHEYHSLILGTVARDDLSRCLIDCIARVPEGTKKEALLFQIALAQCWTDEGWADKRFEELASLAERRPALKPIFDRGIHDDIPQWRRDETAREMAHKTKNARDLAATLANLSRDIADVRAGKAIGWLDWGAQIYFAQFDGLDDSLTQRERLVSVVGEDNARAVLEGFAALVKRPDLPSPADAATIAVTGQRGTWWIALLAGLEEAWEGREETDMFSDAFWRSALAIQLVAPHFERNEQRRKILRWREAIIEARPDLAREAYEGVSRVYLGSDKEHIDGLHDLLHEPALASFRDDVALALLDAFPFPPAYALADLLDHALAATARRDDLLRIIRRVVAGPPGDKPGHWDRWLVTGFLLSPSEFEPHLKARLAVDRNAVWLLRDLTRGEYGESPTFPLTIAQEETIIALAGGLFPVALHPSNVMHGNTNPWDAADFVHRMINSLSALPHAAATEALERLIANPVLGSYRDTLGHALAQQRTRRRDAEYHRPNWDEATAGFANGPPANVADLCALTVSQLEDIAVHIRSANTDIYKQFWNLDSWSRPTTTRPEEACRDALLNLLRPHMIACEATAEPEGHMVDDKRADIAVARPGMKVVIELKKDTHKDVWSAAQEQLDRFYTRDPEAKGFGIYGVFWFAATRGRKLPAAPNGIAEPKTAVEMAHSLRKLLPENVRARIALVVFDVAAPDA